MHNNSTQEGLFIRIAESNKSSGFFLSASLPHGELFTAGMWQGTAPFLFLFMLFTETGMENLLI